MKVIRKFTAIQLETECINDNVNAKLCFGKLDGPHYNVTHPKEEFDTEEEAIEYSYKYDKYARWMIVPIIRFDNY